MSEIPTRLYPPPPDTPPPPDEQPSHVVMAGDVLACEISENSGPIQHRWVTVQGPVELRSRGFDHRLELRNVIFEDLVDLRDTRFRKTVDLRGCTFRRGLRMDGTRIDGSLLMKRVTIAGCAEDERGRAARLALLRVGGHILARGLVAEGGVDLTRAEIRGHVDLSALLAQRSRCAGDLIMNFARVGGDVRLAGILVEGGLEAKAVRLDANFSAGPLRENPERDEGEVVGVTEIRRKVVLDSARITGEVSFVAAKIGGDLDFQAVEVRGGFFCRARRGHQPEIRGDMKGPAARIMATLDISGAIVRGDVVLDGVKVQGSVFMWNGWHSHDGAPPRPGGAPPPKVAPRYPDLRTRIDGTLEMNHATVTGVIQAVDMVVGKSVILNLAVVGGWVSFDKSVLKQDLHLEGARITRRFSCRCQDGRHPMVLGSIRGRAAHLGAGLCLSGIEVLKDVLFPGARIEGPVEMDVPGDLSPAPAEPGDGLAPDSAPGVADPVPRAAGEGTCDLRTTVRGNIDFGHAVIGGALRLAGLRCGESVLLEGANVAGYVDLSGAHIGFPPGVAPPDPDADPDALLRAAGERRSSGSPSVNAMALRLLGNARFAGARIAGDLNLQSTRICAGVKFGVDVSGSKPTTERPVVGGSVMLGGATVLGEADFRAAWIGGDLSLERATVDGMLRCRLVAPSGPDWRSHLCTQVRQLNLRNCTVDYLDLQGVERRGDGQICEEAGCAQQVPILLEGCQFEEISVPGTGKDKDYQFLFRAQDGDNFRQSNFVLVEQWLRNRGEDDVAEDVYRLMRDRRRATMHGWQSKLADRFVCALRQVALRFQTLIVLALVMYCVTVAVFWDRTSVVPKNPLARAPVSWSPADAFLVAAQVHLPMLSLPGKDLWEPARRRIGTSGPSLRYDGYAMVISLLSYVLVPLVIGGIATTWLRKARTPG